MIQCNMSETERTVRSLVGLPIIAGGYYFRHLSEAWSQILFWGGMSLAISAVVTWCPLKALARLIRGSGRQQ